MLLWVVFLGLFLLCAAVSVVFTVYLCLLWYASLGSSSSPTAHPPPSDHQKRPGSGGLSSQELRMLPGAGDAVETAAAGCECSVCLDDIEAGQPARVLPTCRHAFHRACADQWLARRPACPVCRAVLPRLPVPPPGAATDTGAGHAAAAADGDGGVPPASVPV